MKAFRYVRPHDLAAVGKHGAAPGAVLKAGGTDLLGRMKERIAEPSSVVALLDLRDARLRRIAVDGGTLRIGALATLSDIAGSADVRAYAHPLAEAASRAASLQIRNRATLAGNLLQHTRCGYYRLRSFPCWKRGDDLCPVQADGAVQETAGIFDNTRCASAHPASLPPVLGALGATVHVRRADGRDDAVPFGSFYAAPERGRAGDSVLAPGDLVTGVSVPALAESDAAAYEEVRQKQAFDWALVSAAVRLGGRSLPTGPVADAAVWLGSVAPAPYRAAAAEQALIGKPLNDASIDAAAAAAVAGARPLPGNRHKVHLTKVVVRRALLRAAGRGR